MGKILSIRNMSVKGKITLFSALMLVLMLLIGATGLWASIMTNKARSARYENYGKGELYLTEAFTNFCQVKTRLRNFIYIFTKPEDAARQKSEISATLEYVNDCKEDLASFEEKLDKFDPVITEKYNLLEGYINDYITVVNEAVDQVNNNNLQQATDTLESSGMETADKAEDALVDITSAMEDFSTADNEKINSQVASLMAISIAIFVISIIITIVYALSLIRMITVPVVNLSKAAQKLAQGDVDVECKKINDDDLGHLMENFADMAAAIREQVKIADIIAKGNLTVEVTPRSEKDVLGKALHRLVRDDNVTLGNIKEAGMQITVGSQQVANASQALAQGSTEQASALEQVTASMDEVTHRTKENATEASSANNLVIKVKDMATTGNNKMQEMIGAMNDINESSETISKIIKTIDDIAFQTNILALNAAVEAARAGVHGKGFAVVAEEVRNLAAKSASAASETADMIKDSINKVSSGTKLVEETAKALDGITNSIDEVVELIAHITSSSNEQATSISQIDQAISQVASVVQTNAATSEQCAAASEELSNQAITLRKLMANYKLKTDAKGVEEFDNESQEHFENVISLNSSDDKY